MSCLTRVALIVAMVAAGTPQVAAQEVPRMFRGLFRPSDTPANSRHRVDWTAAAGVTYGQADLDLNSLPAAFDVRLYEATTANTTQVIQYAFTGVRRVFAAAAGGSFWRYQSLGWETTRFFSAMRFATPTGPRTNVSLRGVVSYTPFYSLDLTVDPEREDTDLLPPSEPEIMARRSSTYYDVAAEWRHRPTVRSEISFAGGAAYTDYPGDGIDAFTPSGRFRYSRHMTEHSRMNLGYGVRLWEYPGSTTPIVRTHDIISGVSYTRPLPFARRTLVGFDIGSAVAQTPEAWRYDVTGGGFVAQPLGRLWALVGTYRYGLDGRAGLSEPLYLYGHTGAVTVTGLVGRRFVLRSTSTYVTGTSLFDELRERNRWWSTSASVSALFLGLATYVSANWNGQDFSQQVGEVTGLPTSVDRFSVSAGFSLGLPLVR
jgi:hypothetical protein